MIGAALISGIAGAVLGLVLPTSATGRLNPLRALQQATIGQISITRPVNILVLGIDNSGQPGGSSSEAALAGNSDTMLLVRLQPEQQQINILSIPRDTLVTLPGKGIDKINDANMIGGSVLAAKTVSQLLEGLPIDRYVRVSTQGLIPLVDAMGGVEVTVPKAMDYEDHTQHLSIHFKPGQQKMSGLQVEEYVRFRHDEMGDIGRVQRQQSVLKELLHTVEQPSILLRLPQLIKVANENIDTNMTTEELLAVIQFLEANQHQMNLVMLPGRFSSPREYELSYWLADRQAALPILIQHFGLSRAKQVVAAPNLVNQRDQIKIRVTSAINQAQDADHVVTQLKRQGFSNTATTDQPIDVATASPRATQIIAQQGNLEAANAVRQALGFGAVQMASTGDIYSDVTVIVGQDLATSSVASPNP
jgi:LCP family protein required for cell wall assembly